VIRVGSACLFSETLRAAGWGGGGESNIAARVNDRENEARKARRGDVAPPTFVFAPRTEDFARDYSPPRFESPTMHRPFVTERDRYEWRFGVTVTSGN